MKLGAGLCVSPPSSLACAIAVLLAGLARLIVCGISGTIATQEEAADAAELHTAIQAATDAEHKCVQDEPARHNPKADRGSTACSSKLTNPP